MSAPLVRRSPTHRAQVVGSAPLTPRMRRVTVRAATMAGTSIRPAQDVELLLREESGRRVKRRYTIRHHRPETGELDLDVLLHGSGAGSRWAETATAGDEVEFQGPRGKLELRDASWHLMVGDESALPAFAAIAEALRSGALPATATATALIEVTDASDELELPAETRWVHRGADAPGGPELLLAALDEVSVPAGPGRAYLMGETRAMVALRAALEARGVEHDAIFVKGYWNVGRPDRLANRPPGRPTAGP